MQVEVLLSPAELPGLAGRDLSDSACAVVDVLRATSTIVTALAHGASGIRPVSTIEEALAERRRNPACLLAGEREGLRIGADRTGGIVFDLGNSPREFGSDRVSGRPIVMTTTNGTRALKACANGRLVLAGAFLNLSAATETLRRAGCAKVLVVASGTGEGVAYEDVIAAGAMCALLGREADLLDSARVALSAWREVAAEMSSEILLSQNARRLSAHGELAADVGFCLRQDVFPIVPVLRDGLELRAA